MSTASYFFLCYMAQQIMQVVVNLKKYSFLLIVTPFFPSKRAWLQSFKSFQQIFLFKCSDWRFKAKLTEQQVVAYLVKSEEEAKGELAIFLTWKTEAHARLQHRQEPPEELTLRKHRISLDFSDVWCINDLFVGMVVRIKWWWKIDYNFDTWILG